MNHRVCIQCGKPYHAKGLCAHCYMTAWRHRYRVEHPLIGRHPRTKPSVLCTIEGCMKPNFSRSMCSVHYFRNYWREKKEHKLRAEINCQTTNRKPRTLRDDYQDQVLGRDAPFELDERQICPRDETCEENLQWSEENLAHVICGRCGRAWRSSIQ